MFAPLRTTHGGRGRAAGPVPVGQQADPALPNGKGNPKQPKASLRPVDQISEAATSGGCPDQFVLAAAQVASSADMLIEKTQADSTAYLISQRICGDLIEDVVCERNLNKLEVRARHLGALNEDPRPRATTRLSFSGRMMSVGGASPVRNVAEEIASTRSG
jgi:hypothetical protein